MSPFDWEDTALRLLEMNLNGESMNTHGLKQLFAAAPNILEELDIENDGEPVSDLDGALYGGMPQVIEIRELKPSQIYHCKACNRSFKRADNFRRHMVTNLHRKRNRAMEIQLQEDQEKKEEED